MTASELLADLWQRGVQPQLSDDATRVLVPAGALTDSQRQCLIECKPEVMELLGADVQMLMHAAMRCCDAWKDSAEARMQMRIDVWSTPPHLRADLLSHFKKFYP